MKSVKLPEEFNYVEAYLTLRCPLRCSYCINNKSGEATRKRDEISVEQWAEGLNRIDFGNVPVTFGGGEPTLYKGFYELMDRIRPDIQIDLLTNLEFDINEFISKTIPKRFNNCKLPAYKSIRVSYHAETMNAAALIKKVIKLQDNGYGVGIFGLNHPLNIQQNMELAEITCSNKIFFFIKDFLGEYNGKMFGFYNYTGALDGIPKHARCRTRELLIGPEGNIYRCHRDLYLMDENEAVGKITDPELKLEYAFRPCHNFGNCNPCDVKIKTNRFLQMGHCSVDIIEQDNVGKQNRRS